MPTAVASTPMIALSITAWPSTRRAGTPKASIVACSRARSSPLIVVVLNAISRVIASTTACAKRRMSRNSSSRSAAASAVAAAGCTEAIPGRPNSARCTSAGPAPAAGSMSRVLAMPARPMSEACPRSM